MYILREAEEQADKLELNKTHPKTLSKQKLNRKNNIYINI